MLLLVEEGISGKRGGELAARPEMAGRWRSTRPGRRQWGSVGARSLTTGVEAPSSGGARAPTGGALEALPEKAQVGAGQGMAGGGCQDVGEKLARGGWGGWGIGGRGRPGRRRVGNGRRRCRLVAPRWGGDLPPRPTGRLGPGPADGPRGPVPAGGARGPGPADGARRPGPAARKEAGQAAQGVVVVRMFFSFFDFGGGRAGEWERSSSAFFLT
jgi:hypothetical protein